MADERKPGERKIVQKPIGDWDDLFPGRFLKAGQLGDKKPTVTIKDLHLEELPDDKGKDRVKGVMSFAEMPYDLAINKTNGILLRAMFGRTPKSWIGKRITLYQGVWKNEPAVRIYGSPDIREDLTVEVKLPRRGPQHVTLHRTEARGARRTEAAGEGNTDPGAGPPPAG